MVEAEFFLELLMGLLTDPSCLDRGGELLERRIDGQVRHIVLLLPGRPSLTDEPDLVAWHALHAIVEHPVLVAIGNANATRRKATCQATFGAAPPCYLLPCLSF